MTCALCIEGKDGRGPARRFWDWVGVAFWQGQAGHNIVKVRSISKMHIPKLLLQLNIILGIGFADHSQVIQELSPIF
jgi:hypothetical protein